MNEAPPELRDSERIQGQIVRMDALLAAGKAAMARVDQFYREHDLVPGFGEKGLTSDAVPERHRIIFARLLAEFHIIDRRIDELDPYHGKPAPVAVGTRAVGNRYRI